MTIWLKCIFLNAFLCVGVYGNLDNVDCIKTEALDNGVLCALMPSKTDSRINDSAPSGGSDGFGYHVIGLPDNYGKNPDLHIHFTGSYGQAFNTARNKFTDKQFLSEALEAGKVVIQLAYDNEFAVNLDLCNGDGAYDDNCAGDVRLEKLTGVDRTSLIKTSFFDSIDFRLRKLISYLKEKRVLPYTFKHEWSNTSVSGHSQGGGVVLHIAKLRKIKRGCMISGGYDLPDNIGNNTSELADWIISPIPFATSLDFISAVVHTSDEYYSELSIVYDFLNLKSRGNLYETSKLILRDIDGNLQFNGHVAAIRAVELKDIRMDACFN